MKRAVIIGGGIGGLASAKILADYFDKVIVYETGSAAQTQHLHVLLRSGQVILEKIFPGIRQKLLNEQCPEVDCAQDTFWENHTDSFPRYSSSVKTLTMGRNLLQNLMRESFKEYVNVEFIKERVGSLDQIKAELILICAGENFPLKRFLGDVIFQEEKSVIDLTYRSYKYKLTDLKMKDFKQYYFQIDPPYTSIGGVISPIENGEVMVTLIEKEKNFSQCEELEDFKRKSGEIQGGKFLQIIQEATPISSLSLFRKKTTHRKTLKVENIPKNIFIMGDVLTSLNPIFGQGMTLTLMQVEILTKMLKKNTLDSRSFHLQSHNLGQLPYFLSRTGSAENGLSKGVLRVFLRICQKVKPLHHLFLRHLHSLGQPRFL